MPICPQHQYQSRISAHQRKPHDQVRAPVPRDIRRPHPRDPNHPRRSRFATFSPMPQPLALSARFHASQQDVGLGTGREHGQVWRQWPAHRYTPQSQHQGRWTLLAGPPQALQPKHACGPQIVAIQKTHLSMSPSQSPLPSPQFAGGRANHARARAARTRVRLRPGSWVVQDCRSCHPKFGRKENCGNDENTKLNGALDKEA